MCTASKGNDGCGTGCDAGRGPSDDRSKTPLVYVLVLPPILLYQLRSNTTIGLRCGGFGEVSHISGCFVAAVLEKHVKRPRALVSGQQHPSYLSASNSLLVSRKNAMQRTKY